MRMTPLLAAALVIALQLSAWAQLGKPTDNQPTRDSQWMQGLLALINAPTDIRPSQGCEKCDFSITATRGGSNSGKPLGIYGGTLSQELVFRSPYKEVDAQTMAAFAYDLHEFVVHNGGGWESFKRNRQLHGGSIDPWLDRSYVPYKHQDEFARNWWNDHSEKFRQTSSSSRSQWVYDALLDATNLYMVYLLRAGLFSEADATDIIGYKIITLNKLARKE